MALDNQTLIGVLLFLGIGYYVFAQKDEPTEKEKQTAKKQAEAHDISNDLDDLKARMGEFESNDKKKGAFHKDAPLSEEDRAGLIEVVTLCKALDKRQAKTQSLGREEARRLHRDTAALDAKAREYLNRHSKTVESMEIDNRNVQPMNEALQRGIISHTRSLSRSLSRSGTFVADQEAPAAKRLKRKPNFIQNQKPADVYSQERGSSNTVDSDHPQSAFETNEARDDTHDHSRKDAEMVEAHESGPHGKQGQTIARVPSQSEERMDESDQVNFNQSPGPEDDNEDHAENTAIGQPEGGVKSAAVIDLTGDISEEERKKIEWDLLKQMNRLEDGRVHLTREMAERLKSMIATAYWHDPDEGGEQHRLLRMYEERDLGLDLMQKIESPNDPTPRKRKRPITQVISELEKDKENPLKTPKSGGLTRAQHVMLSRTSPDNL